MVTEPSSNPWRDALRLAQPYLILFISVVLIPTVLWGINMEYRQRADEALHSEGGVFVSNTAGVSDTEALLRAVDLKIEQQVPRATSAYRSGLEGRIQGLQNSLDALEKKMDRLLELRAGG